MSGISRHGRKHGVVAVVITGGCEQDLVPLCKKKQLQQVGTAAGASANYSDEGDFGGKAEQREGHEHGESKQANGSPEPKGGSDIRNDGGGDSSTELTEEALIPLANAPLLLYPLLRLEELFTLSGMRSVAIACSTEEEARAVRHWLDRRYSSHPSRPHVIVISAATTNSEQQTEGHGGVGGVGVASAHVVAQAFHQGLGSDFDFAEDVIVMHGNLVSDVQLEAVVAAHRLRKATATVMLARPRDEQIQLKSSSKKGGAALKPVPSKKTKPKPKTFVGLDTEGDREQLCLWMSEKSSKIMPNGKRQPLRQVQLSRKILKHIPHVNISSNLMDLDVAVFSRDVFDEKIALQGLHSVSEDLIPFLVKEQFQDSDSSQETLPKREIIQGGNKAAETAAALAAPVTGGASSSSSSSSSKASEMNEGVNKGMAGGDSSNGGVGGNSEQKMMDEDSNRDNNHLNSGSEGAQVEESISRTSSQGSKQERKSSSNGSNVYAGDLSFGRLQQIIGEMTHGDYEYLDVKDKKSRLCSVYIVPPENYCAKVESIEDYAEISKDLTSAEFSHMLPPGLDLQARPSEVGSKSTVGTGCLFGGNVKLGDKCSVKRSIVGAKCTFGDHVKIVNSVIMDGTTIGDGSHIQNCVLCKQVQVGEKCTLKDCNVAAQWTIAGGMDHRGETLADPNMLL